MFIVLLIWVVLVLAIEIFSNVAESFLQKKKKIKIKKKSEKERRKSANSK